MNFLKSYYVKHSQQQSYAIYLFKIKAKQRTKEQDGSMAHRGSVCQTQFQHRKNEHHRHAGR